MATLTLGPSNAAFQYQGQPSWTESLDAGDSGTSFQVKVPRGSVAPPDEGLACLKSSSGGKLYAAWYEGVKVDDDGNGDRLYAIQTTDLGTFLTNLKTIKGYREKARLADHARALLGYGGAANGDWPHDLLFVNCPVTDPFEYQADGIFLQQAFQEMCAQTKTFVKFDYGGWTNPAAINVPIAGATFLPLDYAGVAAPHDIKIGAQPALCEPMNTIYGLSYELGPLGPSRVIVSGKNAVFDLVDKAPLAPATDTIETTVVAGSTQRQFPLGKGFTRIVFARISTMGDPLKLWRMREDDPENFTDDDGLPVDALVNLTADPPLLVFPPDPAPPPGGGSGFVLTVKYATEFVIVKKEIEGRAAQLGASLGVSFPVERDYLIKRDDIDLIEDAQLLADSEAERLSQRTFSCTFKTKKGGWNAGSVFQFEDTVKSRVSRQIARRVQRTLVSSDGVNDIIESAIQASNQPIVTVGQKTAAGFRQSLLPKSAKIRLP